MRTAAQAGQQQQFQQHLQQFRMMTQPGPGMTQLVSYTQGPGQAAVQAGPWIAARAGSGSGGGPAAATQNAAAAAAAGGGGSAAEVPWWQQGHQQQQPQAPLGASLLLPDAEVYQGLLDSKVLAEPKKAAQSAWEHWEQGRTVAQIATEGREKPIQVCRVCKTVQFYGQVYSQCSTLPSSMHVQTSASPLEASSRMVHSAWSHVQPNGDGGAVSATNQPGPIAVKGMCNGSLLPLLTPGNTLLGHMPTHPLPLPAAAAHTGSHRAGIPSRSSCIIRLLSAARASAAGVSGSDRGRWRDCTAVAANSSPQQQQGQQPVFPEISAAF
jgi:hypothetical protein